MEAEPDHESEKPARGAKSVTVIFRDDAQFTYRGILEQCLMSAP